MHEEAEMVLQAVALGDGALQHRLDPSASRFGLDRIFAE
jgi:hypothetical protein